MRWTWSWANFSPLCSSCHHFTPCLCVGSADAAARTTITGFFQVFNISLVNFDLFNFEDVSPTLKQPEIMSHFKIRARGNGCDPRNIDRHSIITAGCEECDWTAEKSWTHNSPAAVDHVWRESHDYQEPVEAYEKRQDLNWTADLIRFLFKHNSKLSTDNWHRFTKCRLGSYYQIKGYCKE